ncbi:hypothetical protein [Desulfoplanes formicivorans]|nr:hypothetical protein [Desulfoplanes formicivorans]
MYCRQCGFHSFDHLHACPKCGHNWDTTRKSLGLQWIKEPLGSWLENSPAPSAPDTQQSAQQATQNNASLIDEDAFMLEEDWDLPASPSTTSFPDEETFTFDQETAEQDTNQIPASGKQKIPFTPESPFLSPSDRIEGATEKHKNEHNAQGAVPIQMASSIDDGFNDIFDENIIEDTEPKDPDTGPSQQQGVEVLLEPERSTTSSCTTRPPQRPTSSPKQSHHHLVVDEMNDLIVPGLEEKLQASQSATVSTGAPYELDKNTSRDHRPAPQPSSQVKPKPDDTLPPHSNTASRPDSPDKITPKTSAPQNTQGKVPPILELDLNELDIVLDDHDRTLSS